MSTAKALVPYHNETERDHIAPRQHRPTAAPQRHTPFLVQLMVEADSDLRKRLGRADVADARAAAYGRAPDKPALHRLGEA